MGFSCRWVGSAVKRERNGKQFVPFPFRLQRRPKTAKETSIALISQRPVAVQTAQEHIDTKERKVVTTRPTSAHQADTVPLQTLHQAHVQPGGIVEPDDQRPGFAWGPSSSSRPRLRRPTGPQHSGNGEKAKPTAMDLYIRSSSTSNEGRRSPMRLRPSKMPATMSADTPKYTIQ